MVDNETEPVVGICLSGGGIRSAAFALGAIQALQIRLGLLNGPTRARYLSAVSGGSYTAAAYSLAAGGVLDTPSVRILRPDLTEAVAHGAVEHTKDGRAIGPDGHPVCTDDSSHQRGSAGLVDRYLEYFRRRWMPRRREKYLLEQIKLSGWKSISPADAAMPGTPESEFVRNHARYLAEPTGLLSSGWSFLWRVFLCVGFVVASFFLIGAMFGGVNHLVGLYQFNPTSNAFYSPLFNESPHGAWQGAAALIITAWVGLPMLYLANVYTHQRTAARRAAAVELTTKDITQTGTANPRLVCMAVVLPLPVSPGVRVLDTGPGTSVPRRDRRADKPAVARCFQPVADFYAQVTTDGDASRRRQALHPPRGFQHSRGLPNLAARRGGHGPPGPRRRLRRRLAHHDGLVEDGFDTYIGFGYASSGCSMPPAPMSSSADLRTSPSSRFTVTSCHGALTLSARRRTTAVSSARGSAP